MPNITSSHQELFRNPKTEDKLNFFQKLLDTNELTFTLTLGLLKLIHKELQTKKQSDHQVYKQYAKLIENLRHNLRDTFQLVMATWKNQ